MGNCTSVPKKKKRGASAPDENSTDNKPREDVTYAAINHTTSKGSRRTREKNDNDCDYAIVNIPTVYQCQAESDDSSKDNCTDDYVLME
ncbi:uncharacterized protein KZ484_015659 [Pholidichthys leucotaenia]